MSIKVGVRVRPFNKRQEQLKCRLCVDMENNITKLTDAEGHEKTFTYDYSFWSHDGFRTDENGVNIPTNDKYADQKKVYSQIGQSILDNAWQGYNCCLFAYGQTGSGKSYSMLGYGNNKGVIPIVCDEIFKKIQQKKQQNKSYEVTVSMMEIYNETVRDLLSKKQDSDLKICEHKKYGVYVQGLIKSPVHSFTEIQRKIQQGSNNRSIAATLMNESSSRSHTIVSINFTQKLQVSKAQMSMKYSVIHLVDLAGSQCVAKTGAISKDRLRQTAKINQSLSTLGRVIETLAQNSSKSEKIYVPYRDSKLTFILRNALGGNSQTAMICAISPADDNMQQTLSTLRYASRAKKIQNKAIVNQSDVDKLIRQLRQENQMLKKLLEQARKNKMSSASIDEMNLINQGVASMGLEEIDEQQNLLDDTNDNKPKTEQAPVVQVQDNSPFITNISQDELLSFRLKYNIKQQLLIGNKQGSPKPDVVLGALGIQALHAKIEKQGDQYFILPMDEAASEYLYLNGENVLRKTKIYNLDRIVLGTGCVFLFKQIGKQPRKPIEEKDIDYQMSISELSTMPGNKTIIQQGQLRQQILKQIQTQYEKTKQQNQQKLKQQIEKQQQLYRQKLREIQEQKAIETIKLKQELQAKSKQAIMLQQEKKKADQEVQKYLKLQQQLQKSHQQKVVYEQTRQILQQKLEKVKQLETKLEDTKKKQQQMKHGILKKQQSIRRQLQIKTIMCQNENIMNDYKLELTKKSKDAKELRDYFIKKQKIQLQKQLVQLVPMIQKFNLMAKDMKKRVEGNLSVKYKYISDTEIAEVLKSGSYKGKFKIQFRIKNKQQGRSYYWNADIFKNRYQLAQEQFDIFIADPTNPRLKDKNADPYWDPPQFQTKGYGYLLVQCIFYNLSFDGKVNIVYCGQTVGQITVKLYPCDADGTQTTINQQGMELRSPRELIDKTIHFGMVMSKLKLFKPYKKIVFEYELFGNSYKKNTFRTEQSSPEAFLYEKIHTFKDISQLLLLHHCQKPLQIQLKAYPEPDKLLQIKSLNSSFASNKDDQQTQQITSQQIIQYDVKQFTQISPPKIGKRGVSGQKAIVFDNTEVLQKIERDYNNKKSLIQKKKEKEKQWMESKTKKSKINEKQKQCIIY